MDKHTVRGVDGSVDVAASANAYAKALTAWVSENEIPADEIAGAVNTVLDTHGATARIPMPALLSLAANGLGATPATFKVLSDRVHAFVTGQVDAHLLFVVKGKGGGVTRSAPVAKKVA